MKQAKKPTMETLIAQAFNENWDKDEFRAMWELLDKPQYCRYMSSAIHIDDTINIAINELKHLRVELAGEEASKFNHQIMETYDIDYNNIERRYYLQVAEKYK